MTTAQTTTLKEIDPEDAALCAEFDFRSDQDKDIDGWLPAWFLGKLAGIEGLRDAIKKQQKVLLAQCDTAERALKWRWGQHFRRVVESDVARSPRRSVDYGTGRAGFRKLPAKLIVEDLDEALESARMFCEGAIVIKYEIRKRYALDLMRSRLEQGYEPPGFSYVAASDVFYPNTTPAALPEGGDLKAMEGI